MGGSGVTTGDGVTTDSGVEKDLSDEAFSPGQINDLLQWYDASDTSTITGSPSVSGLADKSGNGFDLIQNTGANQLQTGSRTINALNVLDNDGARYMATDGNVTGIADSIEIFWLGEIDASSSNADGIYTFQGVSSSTDLQVDAGNASEFRYRVTGVVDFNVTNTNYEGAPHIFGFNLDDANSAWDKQVDGTSVDSDTNYTRDLEASMPFNFFTNRASSEYPEGAFAEFIMYNRFLETAERAQVIDYLKEKWNIA